MAQAVFAPIGQLFCAWTQGSRKFAIYVHRDVLARLGMEVRVAFKRVPRRGLEVGGILVGRRECRDEITTFWIEGFEAIESEHRSGPSYILSELDFALLREALTRNGAASIGIYRSQTRSQQLTLQEPDIQLFGKCFDRGDGLFLIACPVAARAAFFLRDEGELKCVYEFGLGSPLASGVAAQTPEPSEPASAKPELAEPGSSEPKSVEPESSEMDQLGESLAEIPPPVEIQSPAEIQAAVLAVSRATQPAEKEDPASDAVPILDRQPSRELAIQGSPWANRRGRAMDRRNAGSKRGRWLVALIFSALLGAGIGMLSHASRPSVRPQVPPVEDLHVTVEANGGLLRLHWDPRSFAARNPSRAVLHVQDGDYQMVKNISPSELSAGSVAYEPRTHDVSFRVEVSSATGSASGAVQVVNFPEPPVVTPSPRPEPSAQPAVTPSRPPEPLPKPLARYPVTELAPKAASAVRSGASAARSETTPPAPVAKEPEKENIPPTVVRPSDGDTASSVRRDAAPPTDLDKPRPPVTQQPAIPASVPEPSVRVWPEAVPVSSWGRIVGKVPLMRRFRKSAKTSMPAPIFQAQPVLTNPAKQSITGPVSVDVRVDVAESGVVDKAEVVQFSDPLNVDVTNSALAAAVRWTFEPARSDDLAVSSKVILHFRFTP
jgi:hypothetical protein